MAEETKKPPKRIRVKNIIDFLKTLSPDDEVSADFHWSDEELYYDEELNCIFGRTE